jgi:M6 family metalloprotease-like protein/uncharacterized repeat protein (TIGR01451 family)
VGAIALAVAVPAAATHARASARRVSCSAAERSRRVARLHRYEKQLARARRRYFRTHKGKRARAAFVRRQQAQLRRLKRAVAACRRPAAPPPVPPAPGVPLGPDVQASLSASPTAGLLAGNAITYTFGVRNAGPTAVTATATLPLPAGLRLQSARPSQGRCTATPTVTCDLGLIGSGLSQSVALVTHARAAGTIAVSGTAATAADVDHSNDTATVSVDVAPLPEYTSPGGGGYSLQLARPAFADTMTADNPWVGEWPKKPGEFLPSTGTLHGVMLFVDFPDATGAASTYSPDYAYRVFTSGAPAWWSEVSYGRLALDIEPVERWYRMSKPSADYGVAQCCDEAKINAFMSEAIHAADADVDFSHVDAVWVIGASGAHTNMDILLYRPWAGQGTTVDGKELRFGILAPAYFGAAEGEFTGDTLRSSHYAATHELGHLLGLPDVYGRTCPTCAPSFGFVGFWDMMSQVDLNGELLAWHRWLLGFLDPQQLVGVTGAGQATTQTLTPVEATGGLKAVVVPVSASKAYVVELRRRMGWDSDLCDSGVLVYTVDSSRMNADGQAQVFDAHPGEADPAIAARCGPMYDAAFDVGPGEVSTFEDASVKVEVLADDGTLASVRVTKK